MRKMIAALFVLVLLGAACTESQRETFQDAGKEGRDDTPAFIINMPDGWANIATKCIETPEGEWLRFSVTSTRDGKSTSANVIPCNQGE